MRSYRRYQVAAIYAFLLAAALLFPACEALRDGVGRTDFWTDRERSKY